MENIPDSPEIAKPLIVATTATISSTEHLIEYKITPPNTNFSLHLFCKSQQPLGVLHFLCH